MSHDDFESPGPLSRRLSGPELQRLVDALVDAFDYTGLRELALFKLGEDLAEIAVGSNLREAALSLVQWSSRQGRLHELIDGALAQNPGNSALQRFNRDVWSAAQVPPPVPAAAASPPPGGVGGGTSIGSLQTSPTSATDPEPVGQKWPAVARTRRGVLIGIAGLTIAAVALVAALANNGMIGNAPDSPLTSPPEARIVTVPTDTGIANRNATPELETTTSAQGAGEVADLEHVVLPTTVQIAVRIEEREQGRVVEERLVPRGSGTIVAPTGLVLTSAQVLDVTDVIAMAEDQEASYKRQGRERTVEVVEDQYILLLSDGDEPPVARYTAKREQIDHLLDLAVLSIVGGSRNQSVAVPELPFLRLGESNGVRRGDEIKVVGYPAEGGLASIDGGTVNSYAFDSGVEGWAWIITDAIVMGTGTGGAAVDPFGRLIGVTIPGTTLECRPSDANRDGVVDEADIGCIPVGGALAKLRPINLAKPLLASVSDFFPMTPAPTASGDTPVPPTSVPAATSLPEIYIKKWIGLGTQTTGGVVQQWPLLLTLEGGRLDEDVGFIAYPTLDCRSELLLRGIEEDHVEVYEELTGSAACASPNGPMTLEVFADGSLTFQWESDDGGLESVGTLWPLTLTQLPSKFLGTFDAVIHVSPGTDTSQSEVTFSLQLDGGQIGEIVGVSEYSSLECSGSLLLTRVAPTFVELFEDVPAHDQVDDCLGDGVIKLYFDEGGQAGKMFYEPAEPGNWRRRQK